MGNSNGGSMSPGCFNGGSGCSIPTIGTPIPTRPTPNPSPNPFGGTRFPGLPGGRPGHPTR